jgi:AdoMet-dependent rRNA methyltransferase SPB1
LDLDASNRENRRKKKAEMWFNRDAFKGIENDEDAMDEDIRNAIKDHEKRGGNIVTKKKIVETDSESDSDDEEEKSAKRKAKKKQKEDRKQKSKKSKTQEGKEDDSSSDDSDGSESDFDMTDSYRYMKRQEHVKEDDGFEVVANEIRKKKRKNGANLTPEELAIGQEMIISKKRKRDIMDAGWNRFMFNDKDMDLPDWFVKDEQQFMRPKLDLDRRVVEKYRSQQKELNVRSIKKVVEAKARKKKRLTRGLDKAKKKSAALMENQDLGSREKEKEIRKLYKKAEAGQKKEVAYVVAKRFNTGKRATRPAGVKGQYKQVDPRMKKDTQKKRVNATQKKLQKRRLKGKGTKPQLHPKP